MDKVSLIILLLVFISCSENASPGRENTINSVSFSTTDTVLQQLFDLAEAKARENVQMLKPGFDVLVEGAEYPFVWVETQPLGGVMYAKRNLQVGKNNVSVFIDHQFADGRIPGMIIPMDRNLWNIKDLTVTTDGKLGLFRETLQGFFLAGPALELLYLNDMDTAFLRKLYTALEKYDTYLWRHRDSDGDGCLEAWCQTDSGEDYILRYKNAPFLWPFDYPPTPANIPNDSAFIRKYWAPHDVAHFARQKNPMPFESIDVMCYSYSCRDVLSELAQIMGNGKHEHWRAQADAVLAKMKEYLWVEKDGAYYYRDKYNKIHRSLTHNNLRAMYFGAMTQEMADTFIERHLLNPAEFWTPMPLPSIAANDPYFRNIPNNNWSGQPQGLTYQRAIGALENYGHFAEVTLIGARLLQATGRSRKFTQQFDPFTSEQNGKDGYGPTILSVLEYFSRMYGISVAMDTVHFNGLKQSHPYTYTQRLGSDTYRLDQEAGTITAFYNDEVIFSSTAGVKVSTNRKGVVLGLTGIDTVSLPVQLTIGKKKVKTLLHPNQLYRVDEQGLQLVRGVPFPYPYSAPADDN